MKPTPSRPGRNYLLLLSGSAMTSLGDGVTAMALPWLATLLTRDPLPVSAVAAAGYLPWLLVALPAGVWIDRSDRRRLMMAADAARSALSACLVALALAVEPALAAGDHRAGWVALLAGIAFLLGTASVVHGNAAQTVLPSIVPRDVLERANGRMWSAEQVMARFIGPPLAGAAIAAGIALPFGLGVATFAAAIGFVWLIALPARQSPPTGRFRAAFAEGVGWIRRHPDILRLAVMVGWLNAVSASGLAVLVLFAQEILGLDATGYGLLMTAGAVGSVLGGVVAPEITRRIGMRASLLGSVALFTLAHLSLGLFGSAALAGVALFAEAGGGMLWNVVTVSYRQRLIPDAVLGRVNSVYRFVSWGAMPLGTLGAGAVVALLTPSLGRTAALHVPYLLGSTVCLGLLGYGWRRLRFG